MKGSMISINLELYVRGLKPHKRLHPKISDNKVRIIARLKNKNKKN